MQKTNNKIIALTDGEAYNYYFIVEDKVFDKAKALLEKAETIFNGYEYDSIELNLIFDKDAEYYLDGRKLIVKDYAGKVILTATTLEELTALGYDEDDIVYVEEGNKTELVITHLKDMLSLEGSENLITLAKKLLEANKVEYSMSEITEIEY